MWFPPRIYTKINRLIQEKGKKSIKKKKIFSSKASILAPNYSLFSSRGKYLVIKDKQKAARKTARSLRLTPLKEFKLKHIEGIGKILNNVKQVERKFSKLKKFSVNSPHLKKYVKFNIKSKKRIKQEINLKKLHKYYHWYKPWWSKIKKERDKSYKAKNYNKFFRFYKGTKQLLQQKSFKQLRSTLKKYSKKYYFVRIPRFLKFKTKEEKKNFISFQRDYFFLTQKDDILVNYNRIKTTLDQFKEKLFEFSLLNKKKKNKNFPYKNFILQRENKIVEQDRRTNNALERFHKNLIKKFKNIKKWFNNYQFFNAKFFNKHSVYTQEKQILWLYLIKHKNLLKKEKKKFKNKALLYTISNLINIRYVAIKEKARNISKFLDKISYENRDREIFVEELFSATSDSRNLVTSYPYPYQPPLSLPILTYLNKLLKNASFLKKLSRKKIFSYFFENIKKYCLSSLSKKIVYIKKLNRKYKTIYKRKAKILALRLRKARSNYSRIFYQTAINNHSRKRRSSSIKFYLKYYRKSWSKLLFYSMVNLASSLTRHIGRRYYKYLQENSKSNSKKIENYFYQINTPEKTLVMGFTHDEIAAESHRRPAIWRKLNNLFNTLQKLVFDRKELRWNDPRNQLFDGEKEKERNKEKKYLERKLEFFEFCKKNKILKTRLNFFKFLRKEFRRYRLKIIKRKIFNFRWKIKKKEYSEKRNMYINITRSFIEKFFIKLLLL